MDKSHSKHINRRLINESGERGDDHRVDSLAWNAEDELAGKSVHLRGFPRGISRKARIQRNHIGCAVLVWLRLKNLAYQSGKTVYQIKHGMLSQYMIEQLRTPSVRMALA